MANSCSARPPMRKAPSSRPRSRAFSSRAALARANARSFSSSFRRRASSTGCSGNTNRAICVENSRRTVSASQLRTFAPHGNHLDGHVEDLLQALQVRSRGRRQIGDSPAVCDRFAPSRQLFDADLQAGLPGGTKTNAAAADGIARDEPDSLEAGQHVELCDDRARQSVERDGVPRGDRIEPSATPRTPRHRSELTALTAKLLTAFVVQLRRQRARAYARAVGLEDADRAADGAGTDTESRARAARDRVRARHVRIGAVADVEQRALSAFQQYPLPAAEAFVNVLDAVDNVRR